MIKYKKKVTIPTPKHTKHKIVIPKLNSSKMKLSKAPRVIIPKKKNNNNKMNFNKFINNNTCTVKPIVLNKNLKPKIKIKNTIVKRTLPEWTLRLTKFESYISSKQLMAASVKHSTAKGYRSAGNAFYQYLVEIKTIQPDLPSIAKILNNFDIFQLDALIYEFLTKKFNAKAVTGGTLRNNACGILYSLACDYGISLTCELLPGTRKICAGADNILTDIFGERRIGKFPLLNPILEKMLDHATPKERFALLIAQRFCLRSQHYCHNRNKNVRSKSKYIKFKDFHFIPDMENPRAISISTGYDKNNPHLEHMERVVYCCCKITKWTCIVHEAKNLFSDNLLPPEAALVQCKTGDMHYSAMLGIIKKLIKLIKLDPSNYGTHSCRSGGTTELFLMGKQAIWIQNFGWWNNIGSVLIYIRPNNPDLKTIWGSMVQYQELREREGEKTDKREKQLADLQFAVDQQKFKRKKGNKTSRIFKQAATMSGHVPKPKKKKRKKYNVHTKYVYSQYSQHTYRWNNNQWVHNAHAQARFVASPVNDVQFMQGDIDMPQVVAPVPIAGNVIDISSSLYDKQEI